MELLLRTPAEAVRVALGLVKGVEILMSAPDLGTQAPLLFAGGCRVARALGPDDPLRYAWRPTWRSHLGVVLSLVAPGAGQFIQRKEQMSGFLFLGAEAFFITSSLLAFLGPSGLSDRERRSFGIVFAASAATAAGFSAAHAWNLGREWLPDRAAPARRGR
jgi:hypothetical protein